MSRVIKLNNDPATVNIQNLPIKNRGRGRPKGSKNKQVQETKQGKYMFISSKCSCVFHSDLLGAGMFCKHKNSMVLSTKPE